MHLKQIIVNRLRTEKVYLDEVGEDEPVFAKEAGKLAGMVVKEDSGWILRLGGTKGSTGFQESRQQCMEDGAVYGFTFHVEDKDK